MPLILLCIAGGGYSDGWHRGTLPIKRLAPGVEISHNSRPEYYERLIAFAFAMARLESAVVPKIKAKRP